MITVNGTGQRGNCQERNESSGQCHFSSFSSFVAARARLSYFLLAFVLSLWAPVSRAVDVLANAFGLMVKKGLVWIDFLFENGTGRDKMPLRQHAELAV